MTMYDYDRRASEVSVGDWAKLRTPRGFLGLTPSKIVRIDGNLAHFESGRPLPVAELVAVVPSWKDVLGGFAVSVLESIIEAGGTPEAAAKLTRFRRMGPQEKKLVLDALKVGDLNSPAPRQYR